MIFSPTTHTEQSPACCTSHGGSYILSLPVKVNDMGDGVNGPPFPTRSPPRPPSFSVPILSLSTLHTHILSHFPTPIAFLFQFLSLQPVHHSLNRVHSHPHNMNMSSFLFAIPFFITNSLHRRVVAVHCSRVPVHSPPCHRRHPHVDRGVSLWQCHRRPQAQRLRCHLHCALR